jgi:hypothetical protein
MRGDKKIYLVTASVNPLDNLLTIFEEENERPEKIIIVDEGDERLREYNKKILRRLNVEISFYGPEERIEWFKKTYGSSSEKYIKLIPERSHAETSFGFLISYAEEAEYIIELDDDVYGEKGYKLINDHLSNLESSRGVLVSSSSGWVNTIDFLDLNLDKNERIFPRGHPYDPSIRRYEYKFDNIESDCVLNMGLWTGSPDLDAVTILYHGGVDGVSEIRSVRLLYDKIVVDKNNFYAICSMNTSFRRRLVPAFYQLYMRYMGIDRFDDIWSGLFAKKIADAVGDRFCLGKPAMRHLKRPRSVWKDLRAELEGMIINEILWRIVAETEIKSRNYLDGYRELAEYLEKRLEVFKDDLHKKFMKTQIEKMFLWTEAVDKIS